MLLKHFVYHVDTPAKSKENKTGTKQGTINNVHVDVHVQHVHTLLLLTGVTGACIFSHSIQERSQNHLLHIAKGGLKWREPLPPSSMPTEPSQLPAEPPTPTPPPAEPPTPSPPPVEFPTPSLPPADCCSPSPLPVDHPVPTEPTSPSPSPLPSPLPDYRSEYLDAKCSDLGSLLSDFW